ncbi:hypothetical protein B0H14DRAFT_2575622, partial [Mycena olivaceomarginata]
QAKSQPRPLFWLGFGIGNKAKKPVQEGEDGAAHRMGRKRTKRKGDTDAACKKDAAAARRIDEAAASQDRQGGMYSVDVRVFPTAMPTKLGWPGSRASAHGDDEGTSHDQRELRGASESLGGIASPCEAGGGKPERTAKADCVESGGGRDPANEVASQAGAQECAAWMQQQ